MNKKQRDQHKQNVKELMEKKRIYNKTHPEEIEERRLLQNEKRQEKLNKKEKRKLKKVKKEKIRRLKKQKKEGLIDDIKFRKLLKALK